MTIVPQSRGSRDGLFAIIEVLFLVALVRGYLGASTSLGRIAAVTITSVICIAWALAWVRVYRRRSWLEVSASAIAMRDRTGAALPALAEPGRRLRFVRLGSFRSPMPGLTTVGGGSTVLRLPFYSQPAVRAACLAHGWQFD